LEDFVEKVVFELIQENIKVSLKDKKLIKKK
jgi:hypothetical protein